MYAVVNKWYQKDILILRPPFNLYWFDCIHFFQLETTPSSLLLFFLLFVLRCSSRILHQPKRTRKVFALSALACGTHEFRSSPFFFVVHLQCAEISGSHCKHTNLLDQKKQVISADEWFSDHLWVYPCSFYGDQTNYFLIVLIFDEEIPSKKSELTTWVGQPIPSTTKVYPH